MFETVSMPVYATIATDRANTTSDQLGAVPRWTWPTSSDGFRTRTAPNATSRTCVPRSTTARTRLSFADSFSPRMFSAASTPTTAMPPMMSPGLWRRAGKNAQVVRHEERADRDRDDVVERQRPAGEERRELV